MFSFTLGVIQSKFCELCPSSCVACSCDFFIFAAQCFPLYDNNTISFNLLLMNTCVISGLGLFLILLYAFLCTSHGAFASILFNTNLRADLLGHGLYGSSTSLSNAKSFYKVVASISILPRRIWVFQCFTSLPAPDRVRLFCFSNWGGFVVPSHFVFNLH